MGLQSQRLKYCTKISRACALVTETPCSYCHSNVHPSMTRVPAYELQTLVLLLNKNCINPPEGRIPGGIHWPPAGGQTNTPGDGNARDGQADT